MIGVRVEDAGMAAFEGPVKAVLSGDPSTGVPAESLVAAAEQSGGQGELVHGRARVTVVVDQLITALHATVGEEPAARVREALEEAIAAWRRGPADLVLAGQRLPPRTLVQGILNVTPDSFSDGGVYVGADGDLGRAIAAGQALLAAGADLIDVGGESTRPGADPVAAEDELARTVLVVQALADQGALVSIDTTKASVARAAVEAGACLVNDVSAGTLDPELLPTVAELGVPYVLMHMQGTPRTMQHNPTYDDVVAEVFDHLASGLARLENVGIEPDRVVIDPGIGFGKTLTHNLALLRDLRQFTSLGRPLLVGASRKTFIGTLSGVEEAADRQAGSVAAAVAAALAGARLVRVHDVEQTVQALAVADAIRQGAGLQA